MTAKPPPPESPPSLLHKLSCGAAMGVADAVPGISGGTIALILGLYQQLIHHLGLLVDIVRRPWDKSVWRGFMPAMIFLLPLGLALLSLLVVTSRLLIGRPPDVSGLSIAEANTLLAQQGGYLLRPSSAPLVLAFFFGLVAASISVPWRRRRQRQGLQHVGLLLLGGTIAATVALLPAAAGSVHPAALLLAGALAISVMLLPGISGSLLLLVLGMYHPLAEAVNRVDLPRLLWVMLGVVLGVVLIIPLLRRLLERAHDGTMAFLSGLMLGSLTALWPWRSHYLPKQIGEWGPMHPTLPSGSWWWPLLAAILGGLLIMALNQQQRRARGRAEALKALKAEPCPP